MGVLRESILSSSRTGVPSCLIRDQKLEVENLRNDGTFSVNYPTCASMLTVTLEIKSIFVGTPTPPGIECC